ncbi:MAG: hypothetical protein RL489_1910 [Pseudomonadota bacterium]|jgi:uncharacterized protein (DUF779 family)
MSDMTPLTRVSATAAALALIAQLQARHGALMFYQSSGCCDNSAPNCYLPGELAISPSDVLLGHIGGMPFYMSSSQYAYWKSSQMIVDAVDAPLGGDNFSLEGPLGKAFLSRSRLFTDEESARLEAEAPLPRP